MTLGFLPARALVAVALWGASFPATRAALASFHPVGLVALRFALALLVLLALRRPGGLWPERRDWPVAVLLGLVLAGHLLLQAFGLRYTSAINTAWIVGFMPVTIALGAHLFLKQRLSLAGWGGAALATAGVFFVTSSSPPEFANARLGDVIQLVSCLTWTGYTLIGAGALSRSGALRVSRLAMLVAVVATTPVAVAADFAIAPLTLGAVAAVLFLGVLCSGVAFVLWYQAIEQVGATRTGATLYFEPFVTLAVAATLLGEPVTSGALFGGIAVLLGVFLVNR